jgi:hypothetical protein
MQSSNAGEASERLVMGGRSAGPVMAP